MNNRDNFIYNSVMRDYSYSFITNGKETNEKRQNKKL